MKPYKTVHLFPNLSRMLYGQLMLLCCWLSVAMPLWAQRAAVQQPNGSLVLKRANTERPRNIIFILTDDHRFDALGFLKTQAFIQTPNLDRMAQNGAYLPNAFVTTALCSPSRASILTGLYAHKHRVVDNNNPVASELVFFSQYLQKVGYQTALVGKWHMGGHSDAPQRGFDYWVSFRGQGTYQPDKNGLNVNGKAVAQRGHITSELTEYALDFLKNRKKDQPFMLYLSHKGVHADFDPADADKGRFSGVPFVPPVSMDTASVHNAPMWVRNQRNSWHGVDFPYHTTLDLGDYYRRYAETLLGVDRSVGQVFDYLRQQGLLESTLVVYMGDNGFMFGEHGLIDKRTAYEPSMRVPMLAHCPDLIRPGTRINEVVANIDVAPTLLEAAGLQAPTYMDGRSFLPLLRGRTMPWRTGLLYEYYWEHNFPQTPTMFALRGDRYKYIHYHGIWDINELYDLQTDPHELNNLINSSSHQTVIEQMNRELFAQLRQSDGMSIPLFETRGRPSAVRNANGAAPASFPPALIRQEGK